MTTWYKTSPYLLSISEVEVTRFTANSVWIRLPALFDDQADSEKKEKRASQYAQFHPTLEEACLCIKAQAEEQASLARDRLMEANAVLVMLESGKIRYHKAPQASNFDRKKMEDLI